VSKNTDTLPKEMNMKKKLFAIALILLIAVGWVFAEGEPPAASNVEATLEAVIEGDFKHGFTTTEGPYKSTTTVENAFEVNPELVYGFKAQHESPFRSLMKVDDFTESADPLKTVGIDSILVDGEPAEIAQGTSKYLVLEYKDSDVGYWRTKSATIVIAPKQSEVDAAPVGIYRSTVTIEIAGY